MQNRDDRLIKPILLILFLVIITRNAWVSDDAYITFRTIENFLAGYGLGYNPYTRVQAYTHPVWMFLLSGLYFLERIFIPHSPNALYLITVLVSLAVSTLTLYLLLTKIVENDLWLQIFTASAFSLSRAFVDYSTSGLENPLTHLLLTIFLWVYFAKPGNLFLLTLMASLLTLNRQDVILLVLPALLWAFWNRGVSRQSVKALALGFIPVLAWELFSIFYYGFPFPNTAYAKLNTGVEEGVLIQQGLDYLLNSLHWDPLSLFLVACAAVAALNVSGKEGAALKALLIGIGLYLLYIVKIGGDFMSGRFLTALFLMAVVILVRSALSRRVLFLVFGIVSLLGVFSARSTLWDPELPLITSPGLNWTENLLLLDRNGIADERAVYFANNTEGVYLGFVVEGFRNPEAGSRFAGSEWQYKTTKKAIVEWTLGRRGYAEGPNVHVIDYYALSDPLLARLPTHQKKWRIGHFGREVPAGYLETLATGVNQIEDPNLALYYEELRAIVQGPLWSGERLVKIWKFNTGQYDHWLKVYLDTNNKGG
ncbi:MAG TPA: hypothetical protein VNK49_05945 [Anaerolineales bacterium]|nr:hypothetical protein [Anaerolineales bacterium]